MKVESNFYAIDLPGFGKSQNPQPDPLPEGEGEKGWTVEDYADVAADFIRKLDLKNTIIVGHSFGGRVGIKLSSTYPNLVSKLVLVDSAGLPSGREKKVLAVVAKFARPFFMPKFMQPLRKRIYEAIGAEDYVATPSLKQTFVKVISEDLTEDLKKITAPTLIITGELDKLTPISSGEKMHSLIPNSKFVILKNAGHFSFVDQPQKFAEAIIRFILK